MENNNLEAYGIPAIRQFCERWGADLPTVENFPEWLSYTIRGDTQANYDGGIEALRLLFHGRWGNYVFEMINMFHVAEVSAVKRIHLYRTDMFPFGDQVEIDGIRVCPSEEPDRDGDRILVGNYFDHSPFGALTASLDGQRRREIAQKYVRRLLVDLPLTDQIGPDDLVIHIRAGDIFQGVDGEGGASFGGMFYAQPPLSFYQAAARRTFGDAKGHVVIIAENALNPVILPLVRHLDAEGHRVTLRLNQPLTTDLSWLLSARHLVFANGTIGIAIALLSEVIETGYFFRYDGTGLNMPVNVFLGDHLKKHFAIDREASYIAPDGWRNTAQQRLEMIEFPISQLVWSDGFPISESEPVAIPEPLIDSAHQSRGRDVFDNWIGDFGRRYSDAAAQMSGHTYLFSTFRRNPALKVVMEHLSEDDGRAYLDSIADENVLNVIDRSEDADRVGAPETFQYRGKWLASSTLRYGGVMERLIEAFPHLRESRSIVEIGGGYGGQARIVSDYARLVEWDLKRYTLVDLQPINRLANQYLDNFPILPMCEFVTRSQIDREARWDLAISNFAFSMFSRALQEDYLELVLKRARSGYLTMNVGLDGHPNWVGGMSAAELMARLPNAVLRREAPRTGDGNYVILFGDHAGDVGLTLGDLG